MTPESEYAAISEVYLMRTYELFKLDVWGFFLDLWRMKYSYEPFSPV